MFKKVVTLVLTIALMASMMLIPVSAEGDLESMKFFSVDYRLQNQNDIIGGCTPVLTVVPEPLTEMKFVQDETLGVPVADFDGTYSVGYEVDLSKLKKDFTVEAYFKLGPEQNGAPWSQVCGTVWMQAENAGAHGFSLNTSSMALSPRGGAYPGSEDGTIPAQGPFIGTKKQFMLTWSTGIGDHCCINDSFAGGKKADKDAFYGQWCHVVYTFDGENEVLYFNNTEIFNRRGFYADNEDGVVHDESNEMSRLFRIAGYNWANNWDMVDMQCAYVNLYEVAATADEVAALFTNKDVVPEGVEPAPTKEPSSDPTDAPAGDPTDAPAGDPTDAPAGDKVTNKPDVTPKPTKPSNQNNTQTFDLGIVSLAAVALSSAVVAKKRKK